MGSYVPNTKEQRQEMLKEIGFQTIDDLFAHIPAEVKIQGGLNIPEGKTELEVRRDMENIAAKNQIFKTIFRGAGAYRHFIPATVKSVISKENLLTAYTPYQAEISQGILQSIFEYQTMICDLTGMDISNACVYDGAEASAEGVAMCRDRKRSKALVSATVNPYVLETIKTYCFGNEMKIEVIPEKDGLTDIEYLKEHVDAQTACVLIQHPNYYGNLEEAAEIGEITHGAGAKYVMNVNPISLGVVKTPAEYGADVAVGEGQPLGLSIAFGGPYLGFMAATQKMMRNLPGRIVGQTEDHNGKKGYVLTLQAREQHIRREKALRDRTADLGRFRRRLIGKPKYDDHPACQHDPQNQPHYCFIHFPLNSSVSTSTAFWIWLSYFTSYSVPSGLRYSYSSSISGSIPTPWI